MNKGLEEGKLRWNSSISRSISATALCNNPISDVVSATFPIISTITS